MPGEGGRVKSVYSIVALTHRHGKDVRANRKKRKPGRSTSVLYIYVHNNRQMLSNDAFDRASSTFVCSCVQFLSSALALW